MSNTTNSKLILSGKILIALYFLLPGLMKFMQFELHLGLMQRHGVPAAELMLILAGIANIGGAVLLLANRHVRLVALGFAAYVLLVNFMLHDFWNFEGIEAKHELQNFIKNLGILAGLLVLAGASKKRSLEMSSLLESDSKATSAS